MMWNYIFLFVFGGVLVAPCYVGFFSSQTRDQTCVPCIGRQILNHWTSRKVPGIAFL